MTRFPLAAAARSTMAAVKLVPRTLFVSAGLVVLGASPAAASPGERYWFYWAAPLFALAALGFIAALAVGYYRKVLRPKYRGR